MFDAFSYNKGGQILHMLRKKVGDDIFQKIIQNYYSTYRLSFASSKNFEHIAAKISGCR